MRRCRCASRCAPCGAGALLVPATASAADSIYWGNEDSGTIRFGNLDGTGTAATLFGGEGAPCGVAIDPAAGKIYWANFGRGDPGRQPGRHGRRLTLFVTAASAPLRRRGRPRGRQDLLGQLQRRRPRTIRVGNLDGSGRVADPVQPAQGRPERGSDRPRGQQDLLDEPDPDGPGRGRPRTWTARAPPRPCSASRGPTRSGSRSTRRPARSTGPTSAPARSGGPVREPGRHGTATDLFGGEVAERAGDRPNGEQDLLGQLALRLGDPGREPGRHGHRLDPVQRRELRALRRAAEGAGEHRAPKISGGAKVGKELTCQPDETGRPTCSGRSCSGRRPASPISGRRTETTFPAQIEATFTPTEEGSYTCEVTASNQAGSGAPQTSAPHVVDETSLDTRIDSGPPGADQRPDPRLHLLGNPRRRTSTTSSVVSSVEVSVRALRQARITPASTRVSTRYEVFAVDIAALQRGPRHPRLAHLHGRHHGPRRLPDHRLRSRRPGERQQPEAEGEPPRAGSQVKLYPRPATARVPRRPKARAAAFAAPGPRRRGPRRLDHPPSAPPRPTRPATRRPAGPRSATPSTPRPRSPPAPPPSPAPALPLARGRLGQGEGKKVSR